MARFYAGPKLGLGEVCAPIVWSLPQWFGIESATRHYIAAIDELPTLRLRLVRRWRASFLSKSTFPTPRKSM
jgi:uncharacterized protein YecE (DUF72 family)